MKQKFINKLTSILKTDIRYLFKGSFFLMSGQVIATVSGVILTIALTHFFNQAEYGLYTYIFSIVGIASAFTLLGMDTAVAQSVARGFDKTIIQSFWTKFTWSLPASICLLVVGSYYLYQHNTILGVSFIIIGIFTPLLYSSSLYGSYFNGKRQFKKIAYDNALKNISTTLTMILVAYFTHNVVLVIISYFVINTSISTIRQFRLFKKIAKTNTSIEQSSIAYGKHLSAMDTLTTIATYIDDIIVFHLLGASSLAIYSIALVPVKQLLGFSKIFKSLLIPKYSHLSQSEIKHSIKQKTIMLFVFSFCAVIFYYFIAEFIYTYLFPKYSESLIFSQVLGITLITFPFVFHTQALTILEKKKELYWIHATKPFIKIILFTILVPFYGMWGAVSATILFYGIHFSILLFFYRKL